VETLSALPGSEAMLERHYSGYKVLLQALLMMACDEVEEALWAEFLRELTPATTARAIKRVAARANKSVVLVLFLVRASEIVGRACLILFVMDPRFQLTLRQGKESHVRDNK